MYGLWRFAYQVNNGLSVVAFEYAPKLNLQNAY